MRQLTSITLLGLLCLVSLSVNAQRGGMGGGGRSMGGGGFRGAPSGGFHGAPSGGFRGAPVGGVRMGAPVRSFAGPGAFAPRTVAPRTFAPGAFGPRTFAPRTVAPRSFAGTRTFAGTRRGVAVHTSGAFVPFPVRTTSFGHFHNGFFFPHDHFHNHFFVHGCFGCFNPFFFNSGFFFGSPFFGFGFAGGPFVGPFGYPYYGYPYSYPSDYYAAPPPQAPAASSDNVSSTDVELATSIQRLSDEVEDLRSENRELASRPQANPNASLSAKEPGLPAVFIFKDGRRVSAQNYAIAGETLWVLDEHAARKFALGDIDATATEHANAINGVEIRIPTAPPKP